MLHVKPLHLSSPLPVRRGQRPHVTILMATRDGARWLPAQLESFLAQSHGNWSLWVSDDGSTDATRTIVTDFARRHPRHDVRLFDGPCRGAAANFLSLLLHPDLQPGIVALSDQDDVWLPFKIDRALDRIAAAGDGAVLYGGQSLHTGPDLRITGRSRTAGAVASFGNALVQNVVSGHSAVLSAEALRIVRGAGDMGAVPFHDWWLYLLLSGAGAKVIVDPAAVLLYRQHDRNLLGAHSGPRAHLRRMRAIARGDYRAWVDANIAALGQVAPLLTEEARGVLDHLRGLTPGAGVSRLRSLRAAGVRRHGKLEDAILGMAVLGGRM